MPLPRFVQQLARNYRWEACERLQCEDFRKNPSPPSRSEVKTTCCPSGVQTDGTRLLGRVSS